MKKLSLLALLLAIIPALLLGCQSNNEAAADITTAASNATPNATPKVSISASNNIGNLNLDFFAVVDDAETVESLQNIISSANKLAGIVNVSKPNYDLQIIDEQGIEQGYHLWVGKAGQQGMLMLMDVQDSHTVYTISEQSTETLISLIERLQNE